MPQQNLNFPQLPQDIQERIFNTIDGLFRSPTNEEAIEKVKQLIDEYSDVGQNDPLLTIIRHILQACLFFFQAQYQATNLGQWDAAVAQMQKSRELFKQVQLSEMTSLSAIMSIYYDGILDIRSNNFQSGLEKQKEAKNLLENAQGRYTSQYVELVKHLEPDIFFSMALQHLMNVRFDEARIAINQAHEAALQLAQTYLENSPEQHNWVGIAHYYMLYFLNYQSGILFAEFELDHQDFYSDTFDKHAKASIQHLNQGTLYNRNLLNMMYLAKAISQTHQVRNKLAAKLLPWMKGDKSSAVNWQELKSMLNAAMQISARAGEKGGEFIRACKSMLRQIKNLERLSAYAAQPPAQAAPTGEQPLQNEQHVKKIPDTLITNCRLLIAQNRINEALEMLIQELNQADILHLIIIQSSRLSELEEREKMGLLSREDFLIAKSKVEKAILDLLSQD